MTRLVNESHEGHHDSFSSFLSARCRGAFLDDVIVLTPAGLASAVEETAQEALGALGLELQPQKTQAWSARAACPPGLEARWRRDGLTLLGVPLGEPLPAVFPVRLQPMKDTFPPEDTYTTPPP